jgi:hypothetical chaperone protein
MFYVRDVFVLVDELKPGRLMQYLKTVLRKPGGAADYSGTQVFDRFYSIAEIIQAYLSILKQRAEQELGDEVSGVTLGRPVKFSDSPAIDQQAEDTLRLAAARAGFTDIGFELEPVAAGLYYEKTLSSPQIAMVFDFGGGTLDIAILRLGDPKDRRVYASGGIGIAGSDFDRTIIQKRFLPQFGLEQVSHRPELLELVQAVPDWIALPELSTPINRQNLEDAIHQKIAPVQLRALQALIFNDLAFSFYDRVEGGKIALSDQGAAVISLSEQGIDLWELYTRAQFELDIRDYRMQIEEKVLDVIKNSGLAPEQIDAVVKTGGSSGIPAFSEMLAKIFDRNRLVVSNTFSSVAAGLAIRAFEG